MCKAPVKLSPQTKQMPRFLQAGCSSCCPTNSIRTLKEKYQSMDLANQSSLGVVQPCLRPLKTPGYLREGCQASRQLSDASNVFSQPDASHSAHLSVCLSVCLSVFLCLLSLSLSPVSLSLSQTDTQTDMHGDRTPATQNTSHHWPRLDLMSHKDNDNNRQPNTFCYHCLSSG